MKQGKQTIKKILKRVDDFLGEVRLAAAGYSVLTPAIIKRFETEVWMILCNPNRIHQKVVSIDDEWWIILRDDKSAKATAETLAHAAQDGALAEFCVHMLGAG